MSICENPVVTAEAADRLGAAAAPLVCVGGQPGVAAMTLLRNLAENGAKLRYHGDFDWGGLRIGNVVFGRLPVVPWRFDTAAYGERSHRHRTSRSPASPPPAAGTRTSAAPCSGSGSPWRRST